MWLIIRARALMTICLIVVVVSTNYFNPLNFQWNKCLYTTSGRLDYQPGFSLEDCISLCWEEEDCKSLNYHRHSSLCELNSVDILGSEPTDLADDTRSIYSEKASWTEEDVLDICSRRKRLPGSTNSCAKDTTSSYCPDPEFIPETEVVLGNLRKIGNNIRYACVVSSNDGKPSSIFAVGKSTCQQNRTWSQSWRPCKEQGKNHALNKTAYQSSTEEFFNASLAVDGYRETHDSNNFVCSHTVNNSDGSNGFVPGWWYVDMGEDVVVSEIVVYVRTDEELYSRFRGITFKVATNQTEVDNDTGWWCGYLAQPITNPDTGNPVRVKCRVPKVGRFVKVTASVETLEMCEVEVYSNRSGDN